MSAAITILGTSVLALLLAGYLAQKFMPPPKPKLVGIDLGTTYSCIGVYQPGTGLVRAIPDKQGHECIPSVVAFSGKDVLVGYPAVAQAEHNPSNTLYDAKRFIGKKFTKDELNKEAGRYQFKVTYDEYGMAKFTVDTNNNVATITPETVGAHILKTLKQTAEKNLTSPITKAVISVPAEFDEKQRNATRSAAKLAGIEVLRIINEPTAAALAYGLHKKEGSNYVMVVDLGGGTLDVSLLAIQGGMFLTQAMAGNNHLGGQDFNLRLFSYFEKQIYKTYNKPLTDPEDLQLLRQQVEDIKLNLTKEQSAILNIPLHSFSSEKETIVFREKISRKLFEDLNYDLFEKVLEPIDVVLKSVEISASDVDDIVLVGGSTRVPKVCEIIETYFKKPPNISIDPELAVVYGVAIQAGIMGNSWPLSVSAIELPTSVRKIKIKN